MAETGEANNGIGDNLCNKSFQTDLKNDELDNTDFKNANSNNPELKNNKLKNANLNNADLKDTCLNNAGLNNAELKDACLNNAGLNNSEFRNADFNDNTNNNALKPESTNNGSNGSNGSGENNSPVGAVMVVGGGIGGIQASLDLADSGYKVYLVEKDTAIGGRMARLDKTFPTNDCAMCILSPKLVDCGRHLNIEIITGAEVRDIQGEAGNFQVSLEKKAYYVDTRDCTGCGDCAEVCPVELDDEFNEAFNKRKAAYKLYPQAIPNIYNIEKRGKPPCREACPAGCNVQGYTALIREGEFAEALKVIRKNIPLPSICGRICHHPCEEACNRRDFDDPVAVASIKRAAADFGWQEDPGEEFAELEDQPERVAIIGSGPAGLSAAYYLRKSGITSDIYEKRPKAGGMLRYGIPEYRLPEDILDKELAYIEKIEGISIHCNQELGRDIELDSLKADYDAVVLALGCWKPAPLRTEGEELARGGIEFLEQLARQDYQMEDPGETIVVGGGNTAMDCLRSCLRLTESEVHCFYRRTVREMPVEEYEYQEALEEGANFEFLTQPVSLRKEDGRLVLKCIRMELGEPDESGRRRPIPIEGSEFEVRADTVIAATGQETTAPEGIPTNEWGDVRVEKGDYRVADNVFTAGDCLTGPASVVEAIAGGHEAALSLQRYLAGEEFGPGDRLQQEKDNLDAPEVMVETRRRIPVSAESPDERRRDYREVSRGYTPEEAREEAARCLDCAICSECLQCVEKCEADCIDHQMEDQQLEIDVGSVILSPGSDLFSAGTKPEFAYNRQDNVLTSIEYERVLSASGPFAGEILRPSDQEHPRKIAFIQCAGSRDYSCDQNYCSSVCCMYTIKHALITLEHSEDVEIDIYYMDIRAYGKGFERYFNRAQETEGINFIRSRVSGIEAGSQPGDLKLQVTDGDGGFAEEEYELVVLASGLTADKEVRDQLQRLKIRTNKYGFAAGDEFDPLATSREGIYACGIVNGPKDIPETVIEASGAASLASRLLAPARDTLTREKEYPPEKELGEELRIGVFICHCGINIGGVIDVPAVVEDAGQMENVVIAEDNLYSCSQDSLDSIKEHIIEHDLNRVVVASCTPRTHEPLYQDTVREAGLNPYLFEMTNIREQASWVHKKTPAEATEKAKDLVRMAVSRAGRKEPVYTSTFEIKERALVVGGGLAGMTAALEVAESGFPVVLLEREAELGGHAARLNHSLEDRPIRPHLEKLKDKIINHDSIEVFYGREIDDISGFVGNFQLELKAAEQELETADRELEISDQELKTSGRGLESAASSPQKEMPEEKLLEIEAGTIILATGGQEYHPEEYCYRESEKVLTQLELEERLSSGVPEADSIYMIQCVGSREEERPYCSRLCCSQALRNAIFIKERKPETEITILYREMRSYGYHEDLYRRARSLGINFNRFSRERKPKVKAGSESVSLSYYEPLVDREIRDEADLLVLSPAILPREDNQKLSQMLKTPLNEDNFFLEAHVKLRPVDSATEGIFICGLAHSPKNITESISQSRAAAMRAVSILSRGELESTGIVASVKERLCTGCGICVETCPYNAKEINREKMVAEVNEVLCQGCGACSAACPSGASRHLGFQKQEILAMLEETI